uniref:Uncharacterized protein n=1 Tax=Panagrolaimus sp. PS1159 TaxID=55785 RepID=A0AC35GDD9_9BILA
MTDSYNHEESIQEENLWNTKSIHSQPFVYSSIYQSEEQKQLNKGGKIRTTSSTLSLHIAAYENFIESAGGAADSDKQNEETFRNIEHINIFCKNQKLVKQYFNSTDLFEIPRQEEGTFSTPEIMQFKASQKLISPNYSPTDSRMSDNG